MMTPLELKLLDALEQIHDLMERNNASKDSRMRAAKNTAKELLTSYTTKKLYVRPIPKPKESNGNPQNTNTNED